MMYIVDMTQPAQINFAPATAEEEVSQNIRTILTTPWGSAPLAREIGLDYTIIDEPPSIAESRLIAEVITAITEQEPRALVAGVSIKNNISSPLNGRLEVVVKYTLA